jgi:MoxR-like ATPase
MAVAANPEWRLRQGDDAALRSKRWQRLPQLPDEPDPPPQHYDADQPLLDAANTALCLGRPLLLTGEPGSGKTEFANHLAWRLGVERRYPDESGHPRIEWALRFDTKSESRARDLFYTIDQVDRFHQAQSEEGDVDPLRFMEFQALGRAIIYAVKPDLLDKLASRIAQKAGYSDGPRRSVVLIDEIDKAPRDFPNDLLLEIERMRFFIPELKRTIQAEPRFRPIVVVTSNSEKALPDAFLRRCVYYNIDFPDRERLARIVAVRISELPRSATLVEDAIAVFSYLRRLPLRKRPGTAEFLDFVQALMARGLGPTDRLEKDDGWRREAALTLLKVTGDQGTAALDALPWERVAAAADSGSGST